MSSQGVQLTIDTLCQHGRRREERCVQMDPEQGCVINDAPSPRDAAKWLPRRG